MASEGHSHPSYFLVWVYLVVLALASVGSSLFFAKGAAELAIYVLAIAKATLVALYFMHLRAERIVVHTVALIPLLFVLILFLGLVPDIVYGH